MMSLTRKTWADGSRSHEQKRFQKIDRGVGKGKLIKNGLLAEKRRKTPEN